MLVEEFIVATSEGMAWAGFSVSSFSQDMKPKLSARNGSWKLEGVCNAQKRYGVTRQLEAIYYKGMWYGVKRQLEIIYKI